MTMRELFEQAQLDALGLLDGEDKASFDDAFDAAPPAVREHIRREQARWAQGNPLLPREAPPADMKDRVMASVTSAIIEAETAETELVGAGVGSGAGRVSPAWRAGSIGLLSAVIILGAAFARVYTQNVEMSRSIQNDALLTEMLTKFGNEYMRDSLFDENTRRVVFTASGDEEAGQASVFVNPRWKSARFFCTDLPQKENETYRVVVIDSNNQIIEQLSEFSSTGSLMTQEIRMNIDPGQSLAIVPAVKGQAASSNDVLLRASLISG